MINHALTLLLNTTPSLAEDLEPLDPGFSPLKLAGNLADATESLLGTSSTSLQQRAVRARFALARAHAVPDIEDEILALDQRVTYVPLRRCAVVVEDPVPAFVLWLQSQHPVDILSCLPDFAKRLYLFSHTNVEHDAAAVLAVILALNKAWNDAR